MKAPFGWMGGKTKTAKQIVELMADHSIYVEPFFGSGAVFFEKGYKNVTNNSLYREVVGDENSNITNFFKQLRKNGDKMTEMLQFFEYSEDVYAKSKTNSEYYRNSTDIEKACLFYFNILSSFGSK